MTIDSRSELTDLRDQAEDGELTREGLDRLLTHADESIDQYTSTTIVAVGHAIANNPEEHFERAKPLVFGLIEAVAEIDHDELRQPFLILGNSLSQAAQAQPDIVDDEYVDLVHQLEEATGLEPSLLPAILAMPIMSETDREHVTSERYTDYCDTCQQVLETVPYDELPGPLGLICGALTLATDHADDDELVAEAADRIDLLLLIGHSEPPIRTVGLEFVERLANLNPEPLELYVTPLITRLSETTDAQSLRSDSVIQNMSPRLPSSASRREATAKALASLAEPYPEHCRPIVERIPQLLQDDSVAVQLAIMEVAARLHSNLEYEGEIISEGDADQFKRIIASASETDRWFSSVTRVVVELLFSESETDRELAIALSQTLVDELSSTPEGRSDRKTTAQLTVLATIPTPPIVEYIQNTDLSDENVVMVERSLVKIVCTDEFEKDILSYHGDALRSLIDSWASDLVEEDEIDQADVDQTLSQIGD